MSRQIEKLSREHKLDDFDCGDLALNEWLRRFALTNQSANSAQSFLGIEDGIVTGYYSVVVGNVDYLQAAPRLRKGLAKHPIPIMLLARLAVDLRWQGCGIGASLLRDAMLRTLHVADMAGLRALTVHAKHDSARSFYEGFGFVPSPTDPLHLFLLTKDIQSQLFA